MHKSDRTTRQVALTGLAPATKEIATPSARFIWLCAFAFLTGNPSKALIFKALRASEPGYQQSYPQKPWIRYKDYSNHALSRHFNTLGQENGLKPIRDGRPLPGAGSVAGT